LYSVIPPDNPQDNRGVLAGQAGRWSGLTDWAEIAINNACEISIFSFYYPGKQGA
jgi:hypothetical protein